MGMVMMATPQMAHSPQATCPRGVWGHKSRSQRANTDMIKRVPQWIDRGLEVVAHGGKGEEGPPDAIIEPPGEIRGDGLGVADQASGLGPLCSKVKTRLENMSMAMATTSRIRPSSFHA